MAEIGDLYALRLLTKSYDQLGVNVRHYLVTAKTGLGATDAQIATAFQTGLVSDYKALIASDATYVGLGVQKIFPLPKGNETFNTVGAGAGTGGTTGLPRQVTGIISIKTQFAGRRYRGRMYIPFPAESDSEANGFPNAAYQIRLAVFGNLLDDAATPGALADTNTLIPVVWSPKFSLATPVTTIQPRGVWATQRRRGSYGGGRVSP